jgi:hypothetical protein
VKRTQRLTRKLLQRIKQTLDIPLLDIRKISHEIRDIASGVGHLLLDVMVGEDFVD